MELMQEVPLRNGPPAHWPSEDRDQIVVMRDVRWRDYLAIELPRGERAQPRLAFLDGDLEFVTTSFRHEQITMLLGRLLDAFALSRGLRLDAFGNATLRQEAVQAGIEPDQWYVTQPRPTTPDLAIEVVLTSGGINKLEIYRRFRVREVWFWVNGKIWVYHLDGDFYAEARRSDVLPDIDLGELERIIAASDDNTDQLEVVRRYQASLGQ